LSGQTTRSRDDRLTAIVIIPVQIWIPVHRSPPIAQLSWLDEPVTGAIDWRLSAYIPQVGWTDTRREPGKSITCDLAVIPVCRGAACPFRVSSSSHPSHPRLAPALTKHCIPCTNELSLSEESWFLQRAQQSHDAGCSSPYRSYYLLGGHNTLLLVLAQSLPKRSSAPVPPPPPLFLQVLPLRLYPPPLQRAILLKAMTRMSTPARTRLRRH